MNKMTKKIIENKNKNEITKDFCRLKHVENNPAHYCNCGEWLGYRGFCSQKCHDKFYDSGDEK